MTFLRYRTLLSDPLPVDMFAKRVTRAGTENKDGEYVLYWAQSARRLTRNLAFNHAVEEANAAGLPVVVYESIRPDYPSANDRIHCFVLEGVRYTMEEAERRGIRYAFFLPRTTDQARGVLRRLAVRARLVVTDDFPAFIIHKQTQRFVATSPVAVHTVDGNGILPMRAFDKEQYSAKVLRDRAKRMFPEYWAPFADVEPRQRFKGELELDSWDGNDPVRAAASCDIDHSIRPVATKGGRGEALQRLESFLTRGAEGYAEMRNRSIFHTSGLSPYLHFGHIGIHEVAARVLLSDKPPEDIDAFVENSIIRRELSFNLCFFRPDYDSLTALPDWALRTLDKHRNDRRSPNYSFEEFERAQTHDAVWNLAQRALLSCGTMHGYLRMLWGKKIIEWSATPEEAHRTMVLLHEKYALDGRDPSTHAGVLWCFGKHDRPWGPERPIFGTIRYMNTETSGRRKMRLDEYELFVRQCEASVRTLASS